MSLLGEGCCSQGGCLYLRNLKLHWWHLQAELDVWKRQAADAAMDSKLLRVAFENGYPDGASKVGKRAYNC